MRTIMRAMAITAASASLSLIAATSAVAADPGDITFSFAVDGPSVVNTITNASDAAKHCGTSLAPAPGGVLPPVSEVLQNGQTLYATGEAQAGIAIQTVSDVPAGTYVVLASCSSTDGDTTTAWISDYPGLDEYLAELPWTSHTVVQASTIVVIEGDSTS